MAKVMELLEKMKQEEKLHKKISSEIEILEKMIRDSPFIEGALVCEQETAVCRCVLESKEFQHVKPLVVIRGKAGFFFQHSFRLSSEDKLEKLVQIVQGVMTYYNDYYTNPAITQNPYQFQSVILQSRMFSALTPSQRYVGDGCFFFRMLISAEEEEQIAAEGNIEDLLLLVVEEFE